MKKCFMQRISILLVATGMAFGSVTEARGMSFAEWLTKVFRSKGEPGDAADQKVVGNKQLNVNEKKVVDNKQLNVKEKKVIDNKQLNVKNHKVDDNKQVNVKEKIVVDEKVVDNQQVNLTSSTTSNDSNGSGGSKEKISLNSSKDSSPVKVENPKKLLDENEIKIENQIKLVSNVKLENEIVVKEANKKILVKKELNNSVLDEKILVNEKKVFVDKNEIKNPFELNEKPLNDVKKSLNVKQLQIINKLPIKEKIIPVSGLTPEVRKLLQELVNKGDPWGVLQIGLKVVNTLQDGRDWLKAFEAAAGNLYQNLGGQKVTVFENDQLLNKNEKLNNTFVSKNEKIENLNLNDKNLNLNLNLNSNNFENKPFVDNKLPLDEKAQRKVMLGLVNNIAMALQNAGIGILKLEGGLIPVPKTKTADDNLLCELLSPSKFFMDFKKKNGTWADADDLPKDDHLAGWFYSLTSYWWQTLSNGTTSWKWVEYLSGDLYNLHLASKTRQMTLQEKELTKNCAQKLISFYYHLLQSNHPGNAKDLNNLPLGNAASFLGPLLYWTEQLLLDKNSGLNKEQKGEIVGALVNFQAVKMLEEKAWHSDECVRQCSSSSYVTLAYDLMDGFLKTFVMKNNKVGRNIAIYTLCASDGLWFNGYKQTLNFEEQEKALLEYGKLSREDGIGWHGSFFIGNAYNPKSKFNVPELTETSKAVETALVYYKAAKKTSDKDTRDLEMFAKYKLEIKKYIKVLGYLRNEQLMEDAQSYNFGSIQDDEFSDEE
jgi:hypothetical protein